MTQKDAMEGGAVERIPPHAKPEDVIYGKPSTIDDLVVKLRAYAGAFKDGNAKLDDLSLLDWTGAGSEGFKDATKKLPRELDSAHTYFTSAAGALDAYADKLRSVHRRLKPIIEDADAARAASKKYWEDFTAYSEAVDAKKDPLPKKPPEDDPGIAALEACYARLDKLESELDGVITSSVRKLNKAAEKAPDKPKGWEGWKKRGKDFLGGMGDTGLSMYKQFEFMVEDGPGGASLQLAGMIDGAAYAVDHPKEFAKAVTNWEEWQRNPSRAAGQLTPELLLALASGGGSAVRKGAATAKNAAQRLASRERALRRDGSARHRADRDPEGTNNCKADKVCKTDPVDVTTGEMLMPATDVDLPGALPLILTRDFVSGHTCGGWFGPTWAATLDQRLELDDQGIVYVADDGMLLTYPVPRPEEPTLPRSGPRWPLHWDGKPDGTMTITMPERNRVLHFAPLPAGGRELALRSITDRAGGRDRTGGRDRAGGRDHADEGDRITFTYDEHGAPAEVTHSGGYRIAVDTDPALHRITALRLLHGHAGQRSTTLIAFGYDQAGDLTEVINSTGLPLRYRYDDQHRITSWTDRNNTSYAYVYDHRGRVLRTLGPDGMMSGRFHYDPATRTTRYTDSLGHTTTHTYNEAHKVTTETDPLGHTTRTEWDPTNRLRTAVTDPLGRTTRYTYDDQGNTTSVERPDGSTVTAAYDDWGLPLVIREANGAVWRHAYDDRGNRTSTTDPTGAITRYTYDESGHLGSFTDPLGHTTKVTTNAAGLPLTITDPLGHTTRVRRGPHGRITTLTDPLGHTTRQGWTIEGKPAWRETPDGARETWDWDGEGNLARHTDQNGHTTAYTHTHFDLPATRTDPDGAHYAFAYDTELRLTTVTNPQGREWRYAYDAAGRLVSETDFNGATRTYELDPAGGLLARVNAMGERLSYTLDPLGRAVEQHDEATGEVTTYTYDATGDLTHAANAAAGVTLERDALGRVLSESVNGRTLSRVYDPSGRGISRTTPTGLTSTWSYDPAGRPTSLTTDGGALDFAYDAAGRETSRRFGATELTQRWDATDRLTHQTLRSGQGEREEILQHRTYAYRPDGYVSEIRELTTGTRRFDLDSMGRVTGVRAHGWTEKYAYDAAGNQSQAEAPAHPAPGDREHNGTLIRRAGRTTYEHDAAGRLTRKTRKLLNGQTRTWTYTWNAEDRLISATNPQGEEWHYTYDPLGRRISKSGPDGQSLTFTWDGTRLAEQTAPDGAAIAWEHAPDTHCPVTQIHRELGTARLYAVVTDVTGTPTELVTPTGEVLWQQRTTLWGTPLPAPAESVDCPLRFPGQYADAETGLHYNYFRYYDPESARYLTPDPLGLAPAPNPRTYVANPHAEVDPLGLAGCEEKPKLSDRNPIPNKKLREAYEEVLAGRGTQRPGDASDGLDYYKADKLPPKQRAQWKDSAIYDVPGTPHRVLKRPDGLIGYIWNHDYSKPRLFPGPWYKDGGAVPNLPKEQR